MRFYNKSAALDYLNKKTNNLRSRLFQEDKGTEGKKIFHVLDPNDIYNNIKKGRNNYYESWDRNTKMVFGMDIDIEDQQYINNYKKILKNIIKHIIKSADEFYDHKYKIDDFIILKTKDRKNKISIHIICRGLTFENHQVCKNFFERLNKEKYIVGGDISIYGLTCLRTCFSTKKGKFLPLLPYKIKIKKEYTSILDDYETERDYWLDSLITSVDPDNKVITKKDIVNIKEEENDKYNPVKYTPRQNSNTKEIEDILSKYPKNYADNYKTWNKIGMALYAIDPNNFDIFDNWSKQSSKYNSKNVRKHWKGYDSPNFEKYKKSLGINSLIYWCKESGCENIFPSKNLENIVNSYKENKTCLDMNINQNTMYICRKYLNSNIFKNHIDKKLLCIQSEKGTGKTVNLLNAIFNNNDTPESVLFISSRRSFGLKLSGDLTKYGFRLYSEIKEHYISDKRVICQVDSLMRLDRDDFDIVIIDECESLARYLTSSHFTKNEKASSIIEHLEMRIACSKNIYIMDADLSDRCMNFYKNILDISEEDNNYKLIINTFTPYQDYTVNYMNYATWLNKLSSELIDDKKLVIPMASNNKAKDLYTQITKEFPDKNVLLIHKETSDQEKLLKLLKVNEIWINYDVVIYTPSVCMGVSFDVKDHFDNIYAYGCHDSLGVQEFCQMLHRVREPKEKVINISIDKYKYYDPTEHKFNYEEVEEMLCNDYYLTQYGLHNNIVKSKLGRDRVLYYPYKEEPIYDVYVRNAKETLQDKQNFSSGIFGYLKYKKYQLQYYEDNNDDDILKTMKEIRKKRKEEEKEKEIKGILEAPVLTKEEFNEKIKRKEEYVDDETLYSIKKYNLKECFSIEDKHITEDFIDEYNDKKKMTKYKNLSTILSKDDTNTEKKLEILHNNEKSNRKFSNCYLDFTFKNKYTYHYYGIIILKYLGFDINNYNKSNNISEDEIKNKINIFKINNLTIKEFLEEEKYGIFYKFNLPHMLRDIDKYDYKNIIKLSNKILEKQYGLKIKKLNSKKYILWSNKLWKNFCNITGREKINPIISRNLIDWTIENNDNNYDILKNIDQDLFCDNDNDSD
jgi:hypothetical protein